MAKYIFNFDAVGSEVSYNVNINDDETLDTIIDEIIFELRERGDTLRGEGEILLTHEGRKLDQPGDIFMR